MSDEARYRQKEHSIQRFIDRYGYILNDYEYEEMVGQILCGNAKCIVKELMGSESEIWIVKFQDKEIPCMFSTKTQTIQTFMTQNWVCKLIKHHDRMCERINLQKKRENDLKRFFEKYAKETV